MFCLYQQAVQIRYSYYTCQGAVKATYESTFEKFYADNVTNQFKRGLKIDDIRVDLRLSVAKHACCFIAILSCDIE